MTPAFPLGKRLEDQVRKVSYTGPRFSRARLGDEIDLGGTPCSHKPIYRHFILDTNYISRVLAFSPHRHLVVRQG